MQQSKIQMESIRSSTQTIKTNFRNVLETFVQLPFLEAIKIRIDLLLEKKYCPQFFADSVKHVSNATVHSSNGIKLFFYSNDQDDLL